MLTSFLKNFVLFQWLSGKRTYIIVAFTILANVTENVIGIDLPGFTPDPDWLNSVLLMFGIGTARAGMDTAVAKLQSLAKF